MASWPLTPRPRLDLDIDPQDTRLRTKVAEGLPKMRRRYTAGDALWTFDYGPVNTTEKATLWTFYRSTTEDGTVPFDWTDEAENAAEFRFAAPPRFRLIAGHSTASKRLFVVRLVLEQMP